MKNSIVTRFAPSPTGLMHIGGCHSALFAWAHAKQNSGKFILRIEDTDHKRNSDLAVDIILESLAWLGLDHDIGPIFQSSRSELYAKTAHKLYEIGRAYYCDCTPKKEEGVYEACSCKHKKITDTNNALRFMQDYSAIVSWDDAIKGKLSFNNKDLEDLVILRSNGLPTYNLCAMVDDYDMGISDVIRGDDHVNNTAKQINMALSLGYKALRYSHMPLIYGMDAKKLSKRNGAMGALELKEMGILPEALINYLARLSWSMGDQEIFSRAYFLENFSVSKISQTPAQFDIKKLLWVNKQYIKASDNNYLLSEISNIINIQNTEADMLDLIELYKSRSNSLKELANNISCIIYPIKPSAELETLYIDCIDSSLKRSILECLEASLWDAKSIARSIKDLAIKQDLSIKTIASYIRVSLFGVLETANYSAILASFNKDKLLEKLRNEH